MKKNLYIFIVFLCPILAFSQNVGIGINSPLMRLHVVNADSALMILENTQPLNTNISAALYFKNGIGYTGAIKTIGQNSFESRLGLFSFASLSPNGLLERISILDNGYVGIGLTSPSEKLDVNGNVKVAGIISGVSDPVNAQDAATKAYVDLLETKVDSLESRLALLTNAPSAEDDSLKIWSTVFPANIDVLDLGTPDSDPDEAFRFGNFFEIANVGSTPGSSNNLSLKGRGLTINNNGTLVDKTDDFIVYTPGAEEIDSFYYVITDLDGLKDTALVEVEVIKGIQQKLDEGETPKQIYDSNNNLLDSLYGKLYQGGLICYLNTDIGTGLLAAPIDQSTGTVWGCYGDFIGGTSNGIGSGQANTDTIVIFCQESGIAARLCDDLVYDGYDDWFLPSIDELDKMWLNLADSDGDGNNTGTGDPNNLGNFATSNYWSSLETSNNVARMQYFGNGQKYSFSKNTSAKVRAIRIF